MAAPVVEPPFPAGAGCRTRGGSRTFVGIGAGPPLPVGFPRNAIPGSRLAGVGSLRGRHPVGRRSFPLRHFQLRPAGSPWEIGPVLSAHSVRKFLTRALIVPSQLARRGRLSALRRPHGVVGVACNYQGVPVQPANAAYIHSGSLLTVPGGGIACPPMTTSTSRSFR